MTKLAVLFLGIIYGSIGLSLKIKPSRLKSREGSGARGSRTLVQTGKQYAFYTLSHR